MKRKVCTNVKYSTVLKNSRLDKWGLGSQILIVTSRICRTPTFSAVCFETIALQTSAEVLWAF